MENANNNRRLQVLASHFIENHSLSFKKVCGIIGVISHEPVAQHVMEGLKIMVRPLFPI
jgi:hypothetical protein